MTISAEKVGKYSSNSIVTDSEHTTTTRDIIAERALRQIRHATETIGIRWTQQLSTMCINWLRSADVSLIIDYAIEATAAAPAPSARYLAAIMRRCIAAGYHTAMDAWTHDEQDRAAALAARAAKARKEDQQRRRPGANDYQQRNYEGEPEINDLVDWLKAEKAAGYEK